MREVRDFSRRTPTLLYFLLIRRTVIPVSVSATVKKKNLFSHPPSRFTDSQKLQPSFGSIFSNSLARQVSWIQISNTSRIWCLLFLSGFSALPREDLGDPFIVFLFSLRELAFLSVSFSFLPDSACDSKNSSARTFASIFSLRCQRFFAQLPETFMTSHLETLDDSTIGRLLCSFYSHINLGALALSSIQASDLVIRPQSL